MTAEHGSGEIDGAFVPRRRQGLASATIENETVIHDRARLVHLDAIATVVWESCDGSVSVDALASELAAAFRVDADTARRDVFDAVRTLAADGLLTGRDDTPVGADGATAAQGHRGDRGGLDQPEDLEVRIDVGGLLLGVSAERPEAREALRAILAAHVTDTRAEPAVAFAVAFAPTTADGAPPAAHRLYDQDGPILDSADPRRILRGMAAALAVHGDLAAHGVGALPGRVIGRGGHAVVAAHAPELGLDRTALARHGLAIADGAAAFVDCSGRVLVGAPGLDLDLVALDRFAGTLPSGRDPEPPLEWGLRSIVALATGIPGDAADALLRLGPLADDDVPATSGGDLALDALLGVLAAVPIVSATDPSAIAARFAEARR